MILVTGGTGLVGSHLLLHLLENGAAVSAIYRDSKSIAKTRSVFELYKKEHLFGQIIWIEADITNIPALEIAFQNIDFVYHCAAKISFDPRDEEQLRKVNIEGTANIVNFCLAKKVKKLCHVSSIAALGDLPEYQEMITEETEWNPEKSHSDYAISKYGAEMEVWRGQQEGLDVVIVNPGVILGPLFWNEGSGKIFSTVAKGLKYYTNGSSGFVAVTDVAAISVFLMEQNRSGERYILVSENIKYWDLMNEIATNLNVRKPTVYAASWMTGLAWRLDWLWSHLFFQRSKLPKATVKSLHATEQYSNHKVKDLLGVSFTPMAAYIKTVADFYRSNP